MGSTWVAPSFFPRQQTNDMKSLFGEGKQNFELIFLSEP